MRTLITALTVSALLSLGTQQASAGDREWATAGKILTGLVIGGAVAQALTPPPPPPVVYQSPAVIYTTPAPVVTAVPAPVVVQSAPAPVVVQPAPVVVYSPPPVYYVRPAPVYYGYYPPRPVVGVHFGFRFGGGHGGHYHYRGHR
jgi:hypothetical protein